MPDDEDPSASRPVRPTASIAGPRADGGKTRRMSQWRSRSWKAASDHGGIEITDRWLPNQTLDAPRWRVRSPFEQSSESLSHGLLPRQDVIVRLMLPLATATQGWFKMRA